MTQTVGNFLPRTTRYLSQRQKIYIQFHKLTRGGSRNSIVKHERERKHITLISCVTTFQHSLFKWRKYPKKHQLTNIVLGAQNFTNTTGSGGVVPHFVRRPAFNLCMPFGRFGPIPNRNREIGKRHLKKHYWNRFFMLDTRCKILNIM